MDNFILILKNLKIRIEKFVLTVYDRFDEFVKEDGGTRGEGFFLEDVKEFFIGFGFCISVPTAKGPIGQTILHHLVNGEINVTCMNFSKGPIKWKVRKDLNSILFKIRKNVYSFACT